MWHPSCAGNISPLVTLNMRDHINTISTEQKRNSLLLEEKKTTKKTKKPPPGFVPSSTDPEECSSPVFTRDWDGRSLLAKLKDTTWLPERHFTLDQTRWVHAPRSLFQEHLGKISIGHLFRLCRGLRGCCWWVLDHPILSLGHGVALTLQRPGHHGELCPSLPSPGREKIPIKNHSFSLGEQQGLVCYEECTFQYHSCHLFQG